MMYQCQKCKNWIVSYDEHYSHSCTDTLAQMRAKVAEHKELQADPDYQLAKAAFTVLRVLQPKDQHDPAFCRAYRYQYQVWAKNSIAWHKALDATGYLTPRRRWQDKDAGK